jgi:hypothetical protein
MVEAEALEALAAAVLVVLAAEQAGAAEQAATSDGGLGHGKSTKKS